MKNNHYLNLCKNLFLRLIKNKGIIVLFSLTIITNVALNFISIWMMYLSSTSFLERKPLLNSFPMIITLFLTVFICMIGIKIFCEHYDEKIIALEKRVGYSNKEIYFSRLTVLAAIYLITLTAILLLNSIFYGFSIKGIICKSLYFNPVGWYLIWGLMIFSLIVILSLFLKPVVILILSIFVITLLEISIIMVGPVSSVFTKLNETPSGEEILKIYTNQNMADEIKSSPFSLDIYKEAIEIYEQIEDENEGPRWESEEKFLVGPAAWGKGMVYNKEYPNYSEMALYFHQIFENSPRWSTGFEEFYSLTNSEEYAKLKKFKKSLENKNTEKKYNFINNLLDDLFDNHWFLREMDINTRGNISSPGKYSSLIEKNYYSSFEYNFFSWINQIFLYTELTKNEFFEKKFDKLKGELNAFRKYNTFTIFGNLSLMYFGKSYGRQSLYTQISNYQYLSGQILNLKITKEYLEDDEIHYDFSEPVSVVGMYFAYAILSITILGICYFPYRYKFSR
ncbi:hypothetical protein [Spiroplasma endosymbiont of Panorpa germanica]|uniref:hypothetical protein n=1 Tax=Spiroplasma endosymbiont of Panorpa germanica TaxID=3066314 RepID=UPI0030CBCD82